MPNTSHRALPKTQAGAPVRIRYVITHEEVVCPVVRYPVIRSSAEAAAAAVAAEIEHALAQLERARDSAVGLPLERLLVPLAKRVREILNEAATMPPLTRRLGRPRRLAR